MKWGIWFLLLGAPLWAQAPFRKHNFTLGGGAAMPGGEVNQYFRNSPAFRVGYGYRFHRLFQVDTGLDAGFGAARIRDYYDSQFGELRIRDYQYMLPIGGRVVIPIAEERVHLYAGGGGAWLKYSERIRQPFANYGYRIDCPVCRTRSGWGSYGMAGGSVALDRGGMFRLGGSARVFRATTDGDSFGTLPAIRTKDRWINLTGEFTISF